MATLAEELETQFEEDQVEEVVEIEEQEEVEVEEPETKEEVEPEEKEVEQAEVVTAPEHWSEEDKELFNNAPDESKGWLMKRHTSMEKDYTQKSQRLATERKTFDESQTQWQTVIDAYAPYQQQLQQAGMSQQQHMEGLLNADRLLVNNPTQGIQKIAEMYGININDLVNAPPVSQEVLGLQDQVRQLQQQHAVSSQTLQKQQESSMITEINKFSSSDDAPYFDEVLGDMIELAKQQQAVGNSPDLAKIYDQAIWQNPSVREKIQASSEKERLVKAQSEANKLAAKAAKANKSIGGNPQGVETDSLSLRDMLNQSMG